MNSPQQVQLAPKDGKALMLLALAPGKTLDEAAKNVLQQNQLQALESRETTVNGLRAITMIADRAQEQGTLRTLSYLIQYGEHIYLMLGVAAAADFQNYQPYFINTMQSFRELNDPAKLNKKPQRIHIRPVQQNGTLELALRNYNMPQPKLEELSLLNGMRLADPVTKGMLIKVLGE
jgi:predicted Zn-dependent protease